MQIFILFRKPLSLGSKDSVVGCYKHCQVNE